MLPRFLVLHGFYPAYFNDLVVGGVCCRVEVEGDVKRLYIMTLGVLAPYRRFGIGKDAYSKVGNKWLECAPEVTI